MCSRGALRGQAVLHSPVLGEGGHHRGIELKSAQGIGRRTERRPAEKGDGGFRVLNNWHSLPSTPRVQRFEASNCCAGSPTQPAAWQRGRRALGWLGWMVGCRNVTVFAASTASAEAGRPWSCFGGPQRWPPCPFASREAGSLVHGLGFRPLEQDSMANRRSPSTPFGAGTSRRPLSSR